MQDSTLELRPQWSVLLNLARVFGILLTPRLDTLPQLMWHFFPPFEQPNPFQKSNCRPTIESILPQLVHRSHQHITFGLEYIGGWIPQIEYREIFVRTDSAPFEDFPPFTPQRYQSRRIKEFYKSASYDHK